MRRFGTPDAVAAIVARRDHVAAVGLLLDLSCTAVIPRIVVGR